MFQKDIIRIAVTYDNGEIFQHFGQTQEFKIYDTVNGEVIDSKVVGTGGFSHCSLGSYLYETNVSVLICGNLGGGASRSLQAAGILVYAGNSGSADEAVEKLLRKELIYNPNPTCSDDHHHEGGCHHHHHGGGCGHHHEEAENCECGGHNRFEGGHNNKEEENAGHNFRIGHDR